MVKYRIELVLDSGAKSGVFTADEVVLIRSILRRTRCKVVNGLDEAAVFSKVFEIFCVGVLDQDDEI